MATGSLLYGLVGALALLSLGSLSARSQSVYYVRAGASEAGNGSDWSNAYSSLPATLQRGATYYVAGGSYPSYTFNTLESGTSVITVKKASPTDHGTQVGWAASYGTSQAVFASAFNISRGYFVIDGQYRNESDWFDGAAYGFKIQNTGNWQHMQIKDPSGTRAVPNVTVKYIYIAAIVGLPSSSGYRPYPIDTETFSNIRNVNYVFSHLYVEGSNNPYFIRTLVNPVLEYSASWKTSGSATYHGEVVNLFYSSSGGGIVRYNHFRDCYNGATGISGGGTGVIAISQTTGVQIYGNIIENWGGGNGAIAASWENYNIKVYNNTFVNGSGLDPIVGFPQNYPGSGNEAYDNLAVKCPGADRGWFVTGAGTGGNNSIETTDVFVNYSGRDYRLARATQAGRTLPSPFNIDRAGNLRGSDGLWDEGAYEFGGVSVSDTTRPTVSLTAPANGLTVSNSVSLTATASDNVGVAGVKLFVGGTQIADDAASPYTASWDSTSVGNGTYQVCAQARDAAGNIAWSATNTITVNNPAVSVSLPTVAACWTFNEGAGTTASDSTSGNTLTLRTGAAWTGSGKMGGGLTLDGVSGRADAANSSSLDLKGTSMTVATWVNLQNSGTWQQLVAKVSQAGAFTAPYFSWHLFGASVSTTQWRPQFQLVNAAGTSVNVSATVNANYGEWVHVVGVYDGTAVRIYVNGVDQGSAAQSGNIMSYNQPLYIGANGLPGEFAKGSIDEVRIYSSALSAAQVQALYHYSAQTPPAPTGLRVIAASN